MIWMSEKNENKNVTRIERDAMSKIYSYKHNYAVVVFVAGNLDLIVICSNLKEAKDISVQENDYNVITKIIDLRDKKENAYLRQCVAQYAEDYVNIPHTPTMKIMNAEYYKKYITKNI